LSQHERILNEKLRQFKGKTKPYDCVVGLSGGKDSSYAAYLLKKKGMSPLAVTFDNCLMTEVAFKNISETVKALSLGHVVIRHGWEYMQGLYRRYFLTAGEFCSVCNVGIRVALYRTARKYEIKLIVSGRSGRTEANSPKEFFTCSPGYFYNVGKTFLSRKEIYDFMYFNQITRGFWNLMKSPYYIELPSYVPWREEKMHRILKKELNWKGMHGEQHADCTMNNAKEFLKFKKFGVPELAAKLSSLIRDGQLGRKDAITNLEEYEAFMKENEGQIGEHIKKVLNVSDRYFNRSLNLSHWPYLSRFDTFLSKLNNLNIRKSL
jgi:tRNA(Ile)-lysidine synthase TilS/MesJ